MNLTRRGFLGGMAAILAAQVAPAYILHAMPVRQLDSGVVVPDSGNVHDQLYGDESGLNFPTRNLHSYPPSVNGMWGTRDGKTWDLVKSYSDFCRENIVYYHRGGSRIIVKDRFYVMPSQAEAVGRQIFDNHLNFANIRP